MRFPTSRHQRVLDEVLDERVPRRRVLHDPAGVVEVRDGLRGIREASPAEALRLQLELIALVEPLLGD